MPRNGKSLLLNDMYQYLYGDGAVGIPAFAGSTKGFLALSLFLFLMDFSMDVSTNVTGPSRSRQLLHDLL